MSEEKKEEQKDFLSGHEALLNSINKKSEEATTEEEAPAATEETPEAVEPPAEQEAPAEEPVAEQPEPVTEPEPVSEPVEEEEEEEVVDQKVEATVPPVVTETPAKPAPKKKKKPANHAEAVKQRHDAVEQAEVKEVLNFINKYVKPAGIVLLILALIALGGSLMKHNSLKKNAAADTALMSARTAADYQDILDQYGKTPSAPFALLGLAQETFNAGAVSDAADLYGEFVKTYPKHEKAMQAAYNQINCIEAQGNYAEAAKAYGDFSMAHEKSHMAPQALLDKARCLESLNQYAEARQIYDDVIAFYPDSGWAQLAQNHITRLNSKM